MNYQNKTKEELLKDLRDLQQKYDTISLLYDTGNFTLAALVENNSDAMLVKDCDRRIIVGNSAFLHATGYNSFTELIGKTDADILNIPENSEPVFSHMQEDLKVLQLKAGENIQREEIIPFPSGQVKTFLTKKFPIFIDKKLIGIGVITSDITERKKAKQNLNETNHEYLSQYQHLNLLSRHYQIVNDYSSDVIAMYDDTFHPVYLSPSIKNYVGYEVSGFSKINIFDIVHPDDKKQLLAEIEGYRNKGVKNYTNTYRIKHKNGYYFWNESVSHVVEEEGKTYFIVNSRNIDKRKKAEQALKQSEERFRYLFRDIPTVAVQGYQFDGTTTYWNKASEDLYGYTAEEAIGRNLLDLIIPSEIKENVRIEIRQMFESLYPAPSSEMSLMRKDGKRVTVISSHVIVQRPENKPELFCLDIDISQRKQAVKQLKESEQDLLIKNEELVKAKEKAKESEEKFKLLNRLTSEMILLKDLDSSYKFIAESLQKYYPDTIVLYVSINESTKKTKLEVISGLNNRLFKNVIKVSGVNPVGKTYELKDIHNDYFRSGNLVEFTGGLAEFSASEFPTIAANAIEKLIGLHKIYTIGVNKDDELFAAIHFFTFNKQTITDGSFIEVFVKQAGLVLQKKYYEKALILAKVKAEQSKKRFKSLIENAPDAVAINDKEGRLIYVSPNAFRHFGYSEGELIGQFGNDFIHPEDLAFVFKAFDTIIRNPAKKAKVQYRFRKSNGEYRWIETTFANLLDNETIKGFVLNFSDITEKKQTLEDLVIAKEKAEESDRLKSAFLSNMSHEIRTPMNGILGFTGLLLELDLSSEEKEDYINVIHQSGQRMMNTVNDIIEISKIETDLVNVVEKDTDLNEKLEELTRFFQRKAEKKGLKLILEMLLPTEKKNVLTDQNKLESILTNLIKNAIKYTESGTINLGCRQKGTEIEFYVKDTGIGIPAHRRLAVFNRFEQADISDTRVFEGSGLGLAISKSYVEMLGGKIWLESEVGKGSTFYFTMPAKSNLI